MMHWSSLLFDWWVVAMVVKTTAMLALTLLVASMTTRWSASRRHVWYVAGLLAALAQPIAMAVLPSVPIEIVPAVTVADRPSGDAVAEGVAVVGRPGEGAVRSTTSQAAAAAVVWLPSLKTLVIWLWAAGAVVSATVLLVSLFQLRTIGRSSLYWSRGQTCCNQLASSLGIRRAVAVRCHPEVASPMAYGLLHPVIFLPAAAEDWSDEWLKQALIHELEHIRRLDVATHVGARIVCALYWFHPLCWRVRRRLRTEAERACDDAVVRHADSVTYASFLIRVAEHVLGQPGPLLAMAERADIQIRVSALLDTRQARSPVRRRSTLVAVGVAIAAALVIAPLTFTRADALAMQPQSAGAAGVQPTFEVSSVRASARGQNGFSISDGIPGQFTARNVPLRMLILWTFGLREHQLVMSDGPVGGQSFDIDARYGSPHGRADVPAMVTALLAARFGFTAHREQRDGPVYALLPTRADRSLGPGLTRTAVDCQAIREQRAREGTPIPRGLDDTVPPCVTIQRDRRGVQQLMAGGRTMPEFARLLSSIAGRDVVDRTGLEGTFDIELNWTAESAPDGIAAAAPALFTALSEQLHVRLESQRGPVDTLVVDRLSPPTPN